MKSTGLSHFHMVRRTGVHKQLSFNTKYPGGNTWQMETQRLPFNLRRTQIERIGAFKHRIMRKNKTHLGIKLTIRGTQVYEMIS